MKCVGKIAICLACELALNSGLRAATVVPSGNPYEPLVVRNVFGLNPPQPVDTTLDTEPPPKITPDGIMTIFGSRQVLFKVSVPAKPGRAAKEDSYILGESQRQDDITVTRIDEKSGVVTFNNHGTVQEIPLIVAPDITTAAPVSVAAYPNPARVMPNGNDYVGGFGRIRRNRGEGNSGNNSNNTGNGSSTGGSTGGGNSSQQPEMTLEEQTIAIEANREVTKQQVLEGKMPPLPITSMTPSDTGGDGAP
jgi:hypothetical protein